MSENKKMTLHTHAVDLARRWSVQNEPDMLQEDMMENSMNIGAEKHTYDRKHCEELASHLVHLKNLPAECMKYQDIASDLKRRDSDTSHPTQWMS